MDRRKFFKAGTLAGVGAALLNPLQGFAHPIENEINYKNKKAKNIIVLVSDGMSSGTLNMANIYSERILGRTTNWIQAYKDNIVSRGLMDMASASSIVTDSAAASSSWGSGERVKNGVINISVNGEQLLPIWQKFKKAGKKAGCVTTVPITHATPAGFTVSMKSRNDQSAIAEEYLNIGYDVLMGGGNKYFDAETRKDKKDMYAAFSQKGYNVAKSKSDLKKIDYSKPILGVFGEDSLPYAIDRKNSKELTNEYPTLAEMTQIAIDAMKSHKNGFVLQVESGKVDWAAHANDVAGLIHDQLELDDALKVALDFAKEDKNTLVIVTTDHGNANPGLIYGKNVDVHLDSLQYYNQTNESLLNKITSNTTEKQLIDFIKSNLGFSISDDHADDLLDYYKGLHKEDGGLYNYKKLPFKLFAEIQKEYNSVGWISMDHSADYVEIAMFGPGQENQKPFMKNTDLHYFMLAAAEVENKF